MNKRIISLVLMMTMVIGLIFTFKNYTVSAAVKPVIRSVEYDRDDKEINVEFKGRVKWRKRANIKVKVADMKGKKYSATITEYDSDDCDIRVKGIKIGKKYIVKISGVKKPNGKFTTVTKKFVARDY